MRKLRRNNRHVQKKKDKKKKQQVWTKSAYFQTEIKLKTEYKDAAMLTSKCWRGNFIVYISICAYAGKDFKKVRVMARRKRQLGEFVKKK